MGIRKGEPVVRIEFPYDKKLTENIQVKTNAGWSANLGCWYIPEKNFNLDNFFTSLHNLAYINSHGLKTEESITGNLPETD